MAGFGAISTPSRLANQKAPLRQWSLQLNHQEWVPSFLADFKRKSLECQNVDEKTMGHRFAQGGIY